MKRLNLYKYGSMNQYAEAMFSTNQIWFAPPPQLNDPFECRPWFDFDGTREQVLDRLIRFARRQNPLMTQQTATAEATAAYLQGHHRDPKILDALRKDVVRKLGSDIGICCLSSAPDSILMWSHYGLDHQGYCLEFQAGDRNVLFGEASPVRYSDDFPIVNFFNTPIEKQVDLIFLTKYTGWAYEQEWRVFDFRNGPGSRQYPMELLTGVTFGLRMPEEDKARIKEWASRRGKPVRFYQAVQHDHKFSIEIREID